MNVKFRVWSFEKKTYIEAGVLLQNGDLAIPTMKNEYDLSAVQNDKFVVEQCTGLKDREGTLIYEGDILTDEYGTEFLVYWDKEVGAWKCRQYGEDSSGVALGVFRYNECLQILCNTHN